MNATSHESPGNIEWSSLRKMGADFGWSARYMGQILTRLKLREGGVPVAKAVELGMAKPNGRQWNRKMCGDLIEYLGVPRLSDVDRCAWETVDHFLEMTEKSRKLKQSGNNGEANACLLNAAIKVFEALPAKGTQGRREMLIAIDYHMSICGVQASFRESLYTAMGDPGAEIVSLGTARVLQETQAGSNEEYPQPARRL